jgi:hypothetical protein
MPILWESIAESCFSGYPVASLGRLPLLGLRPETVLKEED